MMATDFVPEDEFNVFFLETIFLLVGFKKPFPLLARSGRILGVSVSGCLAYWHEVGVKETAKKRYRR